MARRRQDRSFQYIEFELGFEAAIGGEAVAAMTEIGAQVPQIERAAMRALPHRLYLVAQTRLSRVHVGIVQGFQS